MKDFDFHNRIKLLVDRSLVELETKEINFTPQEIGNIEKINKIITVIDEREKNIKPKSELEDMTDEELEALASGD